MSEHPKSLRVATIVPTPPDSIGGAHVATGTKVLLSDGSELENVRSVELKASTETDLWLAVITLLPEEVPKIAADAEIVEGEVIKFATSTLLDPLEQAIDQAVRLVSESTGALAERLSRHLDRLLAMQLGRLEPMERQA